MPVWKPLILRRLVTAALAAVVLAHALPAQANSEADEPIDQSILMQGAANRALQYIGVPYRFGGSNPKSGFDCSGLVNHVYRETLGLALPRTARQLASVGAPVAASDLRPGDLVFFNTRGSANSHVGIYLGDGRFVHAPRARTLVRIDRLDDPGYVRLFEGARRLDPLTLLMTPADPRL